MTEYLEQIGTGRKFVATDRLRKRKDMRPTDWQPSKETESTSTDEAEPEAEGSETEGSEAEETEEEAPTAEPADGEAGPIIIVDGAEVPLRAASKKALEAYAKEHFGVDLDRRKTQASLADEVEALIAGGEE